MPMPVRTESIKNLEDLLGLNLMLEDSKTKANSLMTTKTPSLTQLNDSTAQNRIDNFLIRVLGSQYTPSIIEPLATRTPLQNQSSDYAYFFLLIIPLLLIIIISCTCLCGRRLQIFIHDSYSLLLCTCFRPKDNSFENTKVYDLTVCFSEYDDLWVNEQFLPQLSQYDRGYKIHKLSLYHRLNFHLSETTKRVLNSSKRIVLIFSEKFFNHEWNNRIFHEYIRKIHENDSLCIVVIINLGSISEEKMNSVLNEFKLFKQDEPLRFKLKTSLQHTLGLTKAEYLNWTDKIFWKRFNYIMPYQKSSHQITKISHSSKEKRIMPKYLNQSFEISSKNGSSPVSRLNALRTSSKKRDRKPQNVFEFNTPRISVEQTDTDTSLKKSASTSLRQVIVPIPNEMRTQLGSGVSKSKPKIFDFITNTHNEESVRVVNEYDETEKQQTKSGKIFLTYNSKSIEPMAQTDRLFLKSENSPSEHTNVSSTTTPTILFDRQPSSKRSRLQSVEITSNDTITAVASANIASNHQAVNKHSTTVRSSSASTPSASPLPNNLSNSKQLTFARKSRRRRFSRSDTMSINGDSSR